MGTTESTNASPGRGCGGVIEVWKCTRPRGKVTTFQRTCAPATAETQHVIPWLRAVKAAEAIPFASVRTLMTAEPLEKLPQTSLRNWTFSLAAGRPVASKNCAVNVYESPPST